MDGGQKRTEKEKIEAKTKQMNSSRDNKQKSDIDKQFQKRRNFPDTSGTRSKFEPRKAKNHIQRASQHHIFGGGFLKDI